MKGLTWIFSSFLFSRLLLPYFFISVLFLFFEAEILVAQADLGTEYIVDSDIEFLILLLPPFTCWKFSCAPPRPMYIDRSIVSRTYSKNSVRSYCSHFIDEKLRELISTSKVPQSPLSTGPGHLNSAFSHPLCCPNCLREKSTFYSQE